MLTITKEGFTPITLYEQSFVAPGESSHLGALLSRYPSFNVIGIESPEYGPDTVSYSTKIRYVNDSTWYRDTTYNVKTSPFVDVLLSEPAPTDRRTFITVLVGWAPDISPYRHTFNYKQYFQVPPSSDRVRVRLRHINADLPAGERLYLAAYPSAWISTAVVNPFTDALRFVHLKDTGGMKIDFVL